MSRIFLWATVLLSGDEMGFVLFLLIHIFILRVKQILNEVSQTCLRAYLISKTKSSLMFLGTCFAILDKNKNETYFKALVRWRYHGCWSCLTGYDGSDSARPDRDPS